MFSKKNLSNKSHATTSFELVLEFEFALELYKDDLVLA
jgi:hypothetical protein